MSRAIVDKIQPINHQERQETSAEVGAKAAGVVWPWAQKQFNDDVKSDVDSTAKNRDLKFVCRSCIFHFLRCEQAFVSA